MQRGVQTWAAAVFLRVLVTTCTAALLGDERLARLHASRAMVEDEIMWMIYSG